MKPDFEVNTSDMQKKMLEILLYYKHFCEEHHLMFYLCGGCLIGSIRHKGFVPWDDDIDCFMPRPDYERFQQLWEQFGDKQNYTFCRTNRIQNYHDGGASLRDNHTTFINRHSVDEDICHGLALEIMPLDGCPRGKWKRRLQLFWAMVYGLFNVQRLPDNKGKLFRNAAKIIYFLVPFRGLRYRLWTYAEKQMTKYSWDQCDEITELIGSIKGMVIRHPKKYFSKVVYQEFEGYSMPVMAGYDYYLKAIWGDYMKLPPVEQRVAKHDAVFIDLNNSYTKYKGVYYCVPRKN